MMKTGKREALLLLTGDVALLYAALWLTLAFRYLALPSKAVLSSHISPFSFLIIVWLLSFIAAGLYGNHTLLFRRKLPAVLLRTQTINIALAAFFFYLIPYFSITPKTNLFIYLAISFVLILGWRLYGISLISSRRKQPALLIGAGKEARELYEEVNANPRYNFQFLAFLNLDTTEKETLERRMRDAVSRERATVVVVDFYHPGSEPLLSVLYELLFYGARHLDFHAVYEDVFDRVSVSIVSHRWIVRNIQLAPFFLYDTAKRVMDIISSVFFGIISLVLYPFIIAAIKLDDGGPVFIFQDRVGKDNKVFKNIKFRTMKESDRGRWVVANDPRITRVGSFLRRGRIDELPQLWNVLRGDISLIGPRPELPDLVSLYNKEIPYYNVRHLIKPGLSGWGQIHHEKPPHSIEGTKEKLSYDLYYLKNRSFLLDIEIALRTIKIILSRSGV